MASTILYQQKDVFQVSFDVAQGSVEGEMHVALSVVVFNGRDSLNSAKIFPWPANDCDDAHAFRGNVPEPIRIFLDGLDHLIRENRERILARRLEAVRMKVLERHAGSENEEHIAAVEELVVAIEELVAAIVPSVRDVDYISMAAAAGGAQ